MLIDLTIVIPVKNEALLIAGCLESIGKDFAKKIVVVDSSSVDNTVNISRSFGAEVINFEWDGCFPKKRNWYLRNYKPDTKWVMFLDADEYLTTNFKRELRSALLKETRYNGFVLRYSIYFMNKRMKGGYPLKKLALFRVGLGEYERIDEYNWSQMDMEIHEHPVIQGPIGVIQSRIDHKDQRSIEIYWKKHQEYASWEAKRYLNNKTIKMVSKNFSFYQKLKYFFIETPLIGPFYFIGSYIFMGAFINGYKGLAFNILKSAYFTLVYCKIKELERELL